MTLCIVGTMVPMRVTARLFAVAFTALPLPKPFALWFGQCVIS